MLAEARSQQAQLHSSAASGTDEIGKYVSVSKRTLRLSSGMEQYTVYTSFMVSFKCYHVNQPIISLQEPGGHFDWFVREGRYCML